MPDGHSVLHATALGASITVDDLPSSAAWYRDVVGFTIEREHEREGALMAVSLRAGDVHVLLTQDDGARGSGRQKGEGISLQLTTERSAIDEVAGRIKDAGGGMETEPTDTPWGARVIRFRDPDGFKLVISSVA